MYLTVNYPFGELRGDKLDFECAQLCTQRIERVFAEQTQVVIYTQLQQLWVGLQPRLIAGEKGEQLFCQPPAVSG